VLVKESFKEAIATDATKDPMVALSNRCEMYDLMVVPLILAVLVIRCLQSNRSYSPT
jgi:hypothetical protein